MKLLSTTHPHHSGSTLMEVVIAVGVLAVAIPMIFGTLAESGKTGITSQVETRSTWIIPACMDEIRASREGRPQYFVSTVPGETFPPSGEVWALAFSADGKPIGKLTKELYQSGVRDLNGEKVRYIASISSAEMVAISGTTPMLRVDISLGFPAIQNVEKRGKLDFHTRIP